MFVCWRERLCFLLDRLEKAKNGNLIICVPQRPLFSFSMFLSFPFLHAFIVAWAFSLSITFDMLFGLFSMPWALVIA